MQSLKKFKANPKYAKFEKLSVFAVEHTQGYFQGGGMTGQNQYTPPWGCDSILSFGYEKLLIS